MLNHLGWLFLALAAPLCCTRGAATQVAAEQNAVYATQSTFETSSPIIYTTSGICIGAPSPHSSRPASPVPHPCKGSAK